MSMGTDCKYKKGEIARIIEDMGGSSRAIRKSTKVNK